MEASADRTLGLTNGSMERRIFRVVRVAVTAASVVLGVVPSARSQERAPLVLEAVDIGAVRAQTGALLLSGQAGGTVEGALLWCATTRHEDGRVEVPFVVEVDGRTLLGDRSRDRIAVGIYAYVVDPRGKVVDHIAQGLILESAASVEKIAAAGLKFVGRFDLEPGDYTLRVMVRNERNGEFYMSWSIVSVPRDDDPAPQLLPPLFPGPESPWLVARQRSEAATVSVDRTEKVLPCARPTLTENRPAEIYIGGGGWGVSAVVDIRILDELGKTVSEPLVRFAGPPSGDFEFRRATVSPIDLPPGEYSLIVTLRDENASEVLRRAVRMTLVREDEPRRWAGRRTTTPRPATVSAEESSEKHRKLSKKEIRAAYRSALRPLAEGDAATARRLVAALERRAVADVQRSTLLALGDAELAEAKALAKVNPNSLMPLALLHRDLCRGYQARHDGPLASHSRKIAITLAEQLGRAKPYIGFPEALMVNFASDLAQAGSSGAARDLLERALRINPGFQPALLALGFSFERTADYLEASEVYESLVDTHPHFGEGRLRLAINLIRTGRTDAGEKLLRELLETGARPWVEAVAAQELVLLRARKAKRLEEAEREVRSALERMPDDQRLWIILASILERQDRHDEAVAALSELPSASRGLSPRARYAEWPALDIRASRAHLALRAEEVLPDLEAALAARGGRG